MAFPAILAAATPFIMKGLDAVGNMFGAQRQAEHNMELAKYQNRYNSRMLRQQRIYDLPANQRKRLESAGLNPALMYGTGSDVAKVSQPLRSADIKTADFQSVLANIGTSLAQNRLMQSQADLTDQKVEESGSKQDLMRAQTNLTQANPYMRKEYVDFMVLQLESTAKLKEQEAGFMLSKTTPDFKPTDGRWERGYLKMQRELDLLEVKYKLGTSDQKVKAEIIQREDFKNDLLKIQRDWLKDGEITPQHIYQGIMLLLSKMM